MGGSSKKVTVGYKYYLGMHMILCHGPVDRILRIQVDGRDAWVGDRSSGSIYINRPNLFGGESREGGIQGTVDFEPGGPTQGQNSYLLSKLGSLIPAYRGVVGVVLRQVYLGLNPYLKKWSFRVQRIHTRQDGIPQWFPERAGIVSSAARARALSDSSLYIALDVSASMAGTKIDTLKAAMNIALDELQAIVASGAVDLNIMIVGWASSATSITRNNVTPGDFAALRGFVNDLVAGGGTNALAAYGGALGFFNPSVPRNNVCVCVSDGTMSNVSAALAMGIADMVDDKNDPYSIQSDTAVKMRGVGINTAGSLGRFDNSGGPIPVVTGTNPEELARVILEALYGTAPQDMNPAHIIRECLTDPDWGMGYSDADVDDQSFMAAADQLYDERMGISILWDRQTPIEDFIGEILRHIDAALYVDRKTGKFTLKLIRGGYNKDNLLHLNEDNIERIENFTRPAFGELTNAVTVNYWDMNTGKDASVTAQDIALQQMQGVTIGTTIQYPGFTDPALASRVAQRDLKALSSQRASCTIYADRTAKDLTIGDVFKLSWADYGLNEVVMRVTGIAYGDGRTNRIKITCTEDVFDLPETALVTPDPPQWEDPNQPPVPIQYRAVFELPYLELVQLYSQEVVDSELALNPDMGYLGAAAVRPQDNAISARLMVDEGAGYEDVANVDFCPGAVLDVAIGRMDTVLTIRDGKDLDGVVVGSWCQIGDELLAVEDLTDNVLTVKRGCLDTVPADHPAGAPILFWDGFGQSAPTEYVRSETLAVRLLTVTGGGELPLDRAGDDTVTMNARAFRPYPPAQLRVNGMFFPTQPLAEIALTWVHRNRVQQTGQTLLGFMDPDVTPEDGTTYFLEIWTGDQTTRLKRIEGITGNTYNVPAEDIPPGEDSIWIKFGSRRDGYDCWQPHYFQVNLLRNFGDNILFEMDEINAPVPGDAIQFDM